MTYTQIHTTISFDGDGWAVPDEPQGPLANSPREFGGYFPPIVVKPEPEPSRFRVWIDDVDIEVKGVKHAIRILNTPGISTASGLQYREDDGVWYEWNDNANRNIEHYLTIDRDDDDPAVVYLDDDAFGSFDS